MKTAVKICGINTRQSLDAAIDGGADYVGFVFYPPSPRSLAPADAATLADGARGRARIVALVVDADAQVLADIVRTVRPELIQLHGSESVGQAREIRDRFGIPVMKAIKVETADDALGALDFRDVAERILFDAKAPKSLQGALPGGNGLRFDWRLLDDVREKVDFMLSGGLDCENVAEAIRLTRAPAVDVSSGVESWPGVKDPVLIAKFLAAAKAA